MAGRGSKIADLIRARLFDDETLRELCDDHRLASATLEKLKREQPREPDKVREYSTLIAELEDEIIGYLLDPGQTKRD